MLFGNSNNSLMIHVKKHKLYNVRLRAPQKLHIISPVLSITAFQAETLWEMSEAPGVQYDFRCELYTWRHLACCAFIKIKFASHNLLFHAVYMHRVVHEAERTGLEPATSRLQVRHPNHYTTAPSKSAFGVLWQCALQTDNLHAYRYILLLAIKQGTNIQHWKQSSYSYEICTLGDLPTIWGVAACNNW